MSQDVSLGPRDLALLRLLDASPLTAPQIRKASVIFEGEPFRDERRVRERMQSLGDAGFVKSWPAAVSGGGLMAYYRPTLAGHRMAWPQREAAVPRHRLQAIAPTRLRHALATADALVHTLAACHARGVRVQRTLGDGQLTLEIGAHRQQPDFHVQMGFGGRCFNLVFEIDNGTELLDSPRAQSLRAKIDGYETYHEWVLRLWRDGGRRGARPTFRVVFLTTGVDRAHHLLSLARELTRNPERRLVYAATQDEYLGHPQAVTEPLFNDHRGHWRALVDLHPSAPFLRAPVRLSSAVAPEAAVC